MSNSDDEKTLLVIENRPCVSVSINMYREVVIGTTSMSEDLERIEVNTVVIPLDDVPDVIRALKTAISKSKRGA